MFPRVGHTLTRMGNFRGRVSSGKTPFTPISLSPVLWLDASDTASITQAAGSVSQWNDKSGNGNHATQGAGASQPITGTRTINGRNVLDFKGSPVHMSCAAGLFSIAVGDNTLITVHQRDSASGNSVIIGAKEAGYSNRVWGLNDRSSSKSFLSGGYGQDSVITASADINVHMFAGRRSGTTNGVMLWQDGSSTGTTGTGLNKTIDAMFIGKNSISDFDYFNGTIAEILLFNRALSNMEINNIGDYIKSKWGPVWTNI